MKLFLGVDGGQSSTMAVIGDETGRVLGLGQDGPCNHVQSAAEGREKFIRVIGGCVEKACQQAGISSPVAFEAACLGFSGGPADKLAILQQLLSVNHLVVTTDALIALTGAHAGGPGCITIAGTGSISFARGPNGNTSRAGGWGYMFGDEGGGFDLTRQALRAVLRQHEGWGPKTALHCALLATTGAVDANDLLHRFYTSDFPRPRIAALSKLIDQTAMAGDSVALTLLHNAAQELALITAAARNQLFQPGAACRVAPIGGVFQSSILLQRFTLLVEMSDGMVVPPQYGPAIGALLEAYQSLGISVTLTNLPEKEK